MAAAGFEDSTAEMSVVILGPAKGQEEEAEAEPQIYPLVTDDDVSEKQLRRCVESQPSWRQLQVASVVAQSHALAGL
jgi:hypothetical protein